MQTNARAVDAYRRAASAVSPLMIVVRCFDEAIVDIGRAIAAIEARDHERTFVHVSHASTILRGLRQALTADPANELADQLCKTYGSIILALHTAFGKPDQAARYGKLIAGLRELREAFAFVAGLARAGA